MKTLKNSLLSLVFISLSLFGLAAGAGSYANESGCPCSGMTWKGKVWAQPSGPYDPLSVDCPLSGPYGIYEDDGDYCIAYDRYSPAVRSHVSVSDRLCGMSHNSEGKASTATRKVITSLQDSEIEACVAAIRALIPN